MRPVLHAFLFMSCALAAGCNRSGAPPGEALDYGQLLSLYADPLRIARLDVEQAEIVCSVDPSGGNNDFNNFAGREGEGLAVLADLKGPGVVTRFWTTGGGGAKQRLQFFFDDERTPRIDATVDELSKGRPPFAAPLSRYEQSCWWTYVPIPFGKRLKIVAETDNFTHEGWPRLFYQINHSRSPKGRGVESFPAKLSDEEQSALEQFGSAWATGANAADAAFVDPIVIAAGESKEVFSADGPGLISALRVRSDNLTVAEHLWISMHWDGEAQPSVSLPLPLLAGKVWLAPRFESAYFGQRGQDFFLRYPMPFKGHARVQIENRADVATTVSIGVDHKSLGWDEDFGYLHTARSRSTPENRGSAHTILRADGRGKYLGCVFALAGQEPSWWVLEGDEVMLADDEKSPGWQGTGLEDYFNGAWYYKNGIARELSGLVFKRAFSTIQYRLHRDDARTFQKRMHVTMERGPDQASHAWMESLAYCYLGRPTSLTDKTAAVATVENFADSYEKAALMTSLDSYERLGDYEGAIACMDRFLRRYPDVPFAPVLRLRRIATRERIDGFDIAKPLYTAYLEAETDPHGVAFCKMLLWLHEDSSHALVSLFAGNPARIYIDASLIGETQHPQAFMVFPVRLSPGKHVLGIEAVKRQYPDWVQAGLRTRNGVWGTAPEWRSMTGAVAGWQDVTFDDSQWPEVGLTVREGPPPAPGVATSPHPFVDLQSQPTAIWTSATWAPGQQRAVFRHVFSAPPPD